jgi:hypothetical protein
MHADLYSQLVDQLVAEVLVTRDLETRTRLLRQAQEWHDKALIADSGGMVPGLARAAARRTTPSPEPPKPRTRGPGQAT